MLCTEDIVHHFHSLKSYERIMLMCKLLQSCLPFELRYLGTFLENLGRKDFNQLHPIESIANNLTLTDLRRVGHCDFRKKLILYLSLLRSSNKASAGIIFTMLCDISEIFAVLSSDVQTNEECLEDFLMVYTLAVNHPAFNNEENKALTMIFETLRMEEDKIRIKTGMKNFEMDAYNRPLLGQGSLPPTSAVTTQEQYQMFAQQQSLPNHSSHQMYNTVPPSFNAELPVQVQEQLNITVPGGMDYVRIYPTSAPASTPFVSNRLPPSMPPLYASAANEENSKPLLVARSQSSSPTKEITRPSSPPIISRPLSAPFLHQSTQIPGPIQQETDRGDSLTTSQENLIAGPNRNELERRNTQYTNSEIFPTSQQVVCTPSHPCIDCFQGRALAALNGFTAAEEAVNGIRAMAISRDGANSPSSSRPQTPLQDKKMIGEWNMVASVDQAELSNHQSTRQPRGSSTSSYAAKPMRRSRSTHSPLRGRSSNRRGETNSVSEDPRKPYFASDYAPPLPNAYLAQSYVRFPYSAATVYKTNPMHFMQPNGENFLYAIPPPNYVPFAPPAYDLPGNNIRISCYNCGSQSHLGADCRESTMDDASSSMLFRLDYTPVKDDNAAFTDKK